MKLDVEFFQSQGIQQRFSLKCLSPFSCLDDEKRFN